LDPGRSIGFFIAGQYLGKLKMTFALDFIHRWVPGTDPAAPVLLLLHGTGGSEDDLLELGATLRPGAALLAPRGKVLENGMSRFFRRLAEGVFDEEDLIRRTQELADFVETSRARYEFGSRPVVAVGYSNGANIAASLLLLSPKILAGAVLLRAMVPLTPERLPKLAGMPVYLAGGQSDRIIPPENTERLARMLEASGAAVTLHWSPSGHQLTSAEVKEAGRWLAKAFAG
jgi:phospholipase/carboxylesterase